MRSLPKPLTLRKFPRAYRERSQALYDAALLAKQITEQPEDGSSNQQLYRQLLLVQKELSVMMSWLAKKGLKV